MPWFTSYRQLNMTHRFSWFNNNNSSTIKDIKNLSTEINSTDLITLQAKFQLSSVKGERKRSFLVSSYSIVKYETLVPNIISTLIAVALKH